MIRASLGAAGIAADDYGDRFVITVILSVLATSALSLLDELPNGLVNRDRVTDEVVMSLARQNDELRIRDFA